MSKRTALILIDHGSRLERANKLVEEIAEMLRARGEYPIVAAAHMELAEPTLAQAFDSCAEQGAEEIIVVPYFLAGGKHVSSDIPALAREAARNHPQVAYRLAEPLGLDERLIDLILLRAGSASDQS